MDGTSLPTVNGTGHLGRYRSSYAVPAIMGDIGHLGHVYHDHIWRKFKLSKYCHDILSTNGTTQDDPMNKLINKNFDKPIRHRMCSGTEIKALLIKFQDILFP